MVGTQTGSVHQQRQGTGLATVLTGDRAVDTYENLVPKMLAKAAQKDVARQNALKAMKDYNPEFFYRHQSEISSAQEEMMNMGTQLLAKGIADPFTSSDPESQTFQKKWAELHRMSEVSKQIKDQYKAWQTDIDGKPADKYDSDSLVAGQMFFEKPLAEHLANPGLKPMLTERTPLLNMNENVNKMMGELATAYGTDAVIPEEDKQTAVKSLFREGETANKWGASAAQYWENLTKDEKDDLLAVADAKGRSTLSTPEKVVAHVADMWERRRKPLDFWGDFNKAVDQSDVPYKIFEDSGVSSKRVDVKEWERVTRTRARAMLLSDPRLLEDNSPVTKEIPRLDNESDKDYLDRASVELGKRWRDAKETQTEFRRKDEADKAAKAEAAGKNWLAAMKSGDLALMNEAAGFVRGAKYANNLAIEDSWVQHTFGPRDTPGVAQSNKPYLLLRVTTPMGVALTDEAVSGSLGISSDKFEITEKQGQNIVQIDLDKLAPTDTQLLGLYNQKYKETGTNWAGDIYNAKKMNSLDELAPVNPNSPKGAQGTGKPAQTKKYKQ